MNAETRSSYDKNAQALGLTLLAADLRTAKALDAARVERAPALSAKPALEILKALKSNRG
jgi:hypothetical protein